MQLIAVADGLWTCAAPHTLYGMRLGTRMTVVRLPAGNLLVHSPIAMTPQIEAAIRSIGPVGHIVCPNLWHHMFAAQAAEMFPQARIHAPAALRKKRPDLKIDADLGPVADPAWGDCLAPFPIRGTRLMETVLFHEASATLIAADLVENFVACEHLPTNLYLRIGGLLGRPGWHRLLRFFYFDHRLARADLNRILALPFERLIIAHGEVIEHGAREAVRAGLAWV